MKELKYRGEVIYLNDDEDIDEATLDELWDNKGDNETDTSDKEEDV